MLQRPCLQVLVPRDKILFASIKFRIALFSWSANSIQRLSDWRVLFVQMNMCTGSGELQDSFPLPTSKKRVETLHKSPQVLTGQVGNHLTSARRQKKKGQAPPGRQPTPRAEPFLAASLRRAMSLIHSLRLLSPRGNLTPLYRFVAHRARSRASVRHQISSCSCSPCPRLLLRTEVDKHHTIPLDHLLLQHLYRGVDRKSRHTTSKRSTVRATRSISARPITQVLNFFQTENFFEVCFNKTVPQGLCVNMGQKQKPPLLRTRCAAHCHSTVFKCKPCQQSKPHQF